MDEYIKRETLLRIAKKLQGDDAFGSVRIVREIENVPAEDVVEVKHGKWLTCYEYAIRLGETNPYRLGIAEHDKIWHFCSLCEQQIKFKHNFCPNCGAKMDITLEEVTHD